MRGLIKILTVIFAVLLAAQGRGFATLVIVIPTAEGVVVMAADSRLTLRKKKYLDDIQKIWQAPNRSDIAFTLTGESEFYPVTPDDATERELRYAFEKGPRNYSAQAIIRSFLMKLPDTAVLDEKMLAALGARLSISLTDALRSRINGRLFFGKALFRAVIVQHEPWSGTSRIGSIRIDLSVVGVPSVQDMRLNVFQSEDTRTALIFGEQKYFDEHVRRGIGQQYIPPNVYQHWEGAGTVRELSATAAATIASGWINATARTTALVPIPSGVGGPVKIYLLNGTQLAKTVAVE